jgi:RNA polymerase sigma-70 factor (ECF subfamily)
MPPLATWYSTREGIRTWLGLSPLSGSWQWKAVRTQANGQPALAFYSWDEDEQAYLRFALNVLSFRGSEISSVTAFIVRTTEPEEPEAYENFPDQALDAARVAAAFDAFGMPERLPA